MIFFLAQAGGDIPAGWWKKCKAHPVKDFQEFKQLMAGELRDKYVFVDTYMQHCPYCYYCLEDFNRIIDDMSDLYGD